MPPNEGTLPAKERTPRETVSTTSKAKTSSYAASTAAAACYSEAINILYSQNTFIFRDLDTVINFPKTVLPQRWHSIRFLRLEWTFRYPFEPLYTKPSPTNNNRPQDDQAKWERACDVISSMDGLQNVILDLNASFRSRTQHPDVIPVVTLLRPLSDIKVNGSFIVRVPFPTPEIEEATGSGRIPYRIVSGYWDIDNQSGFVPTSSRWW
ncbi:MAG: hypothetical protein M1812_004870 [Candelaria pacifica]|nr:MAG: hypothetical protein M1812_004870 [Candelaria pacifica]